jgi:hypothetical protein
MSENIDTDNLYNNCLVSLNNLFDLYEKNDYMLQRIQTQIVNYLPNTLKNELLNHEKRVYRNHFLTNEQQVFIQIFLNKNKYYYLPNNSYFYEYDNKHYSIVKEDDIIHQLLSSISKERVLLDWKHKTKINVIKLIKERNLFNSIPDTDTIQNVLNVIYPSLFLSKMQAKYFLTIIGDNILKKNQHLNFFISQNMKKLLTELENVSYLSIGNNNTTNNFVTKYHENHSYSNYRLFKINEVFSLELWREQIKKIGLDLLCVATHYSKRYENSENFLENKCDDDLKTNILYLSLNTQQQIISNFCANFLNKVNDKDTTIHWKNLHFIWKQFLSVNHLPNMIYSNTLKNILKETYDYNENADCFHNLTSKYLPIESDFIKFWKKAIQIASENASDMIETFDELEIDELCMLFKFWTQNNINKEDKLISNGNINEENVLKILKHFFPLVEIIENKYVLNVKCIIWDKNAEIENSFHFIKEQIKINHSLALISFDDAYNHYYKFCNSQSNKLIVSKRYFEKYLYSKISKYIVYEKFIETLWVYE